MAVSQKVKPKAVDITTSLNLMGTTEPAVTPVVVESPSIPKIETGAPFSTVREKTKEEPVLMPTTKDTQIIFRTTESNKNSLKGFFATYGFSLSKGIQLACFYLEQEIKSGNITIGPAGILKKER